MNKKNRLAERRIDKEIAKRAPNIYVYHIVRDIVELTDKINGITIVSDIEIDYKKLIELINDKADDLDMYVGGVFPGAIKKCLIDNGYTGVAVCDRRDQFDHADGRRRAKRNWLRTHSYKHPRVKEFMTRAENKITTEKALTLGQLEYYKTLIDGIEVGYGWTKDEAIAYGERLLKLKSGMTKEFI